jgi:Major Facilitator Superfamily
MTDKPNTELTRTDTGAKQAWTLALVSLGLFMTALDTLVVTTALPVLRVSLHTSLSDLEWTVNAYNLSFACSLLTGAALGDRFGRRRMFCLGLAVFTAASAASALAPTVGVLIATPALQGAGAAMVMPLTLTLISEAFPADKRGMAIGMWGGIAGLAVAAGPVVGAQSSRASTGTGSSGSTSRSACCSSRCQHPASTRALAHDPASMSSAWSRAHPSCGRSFSVHSRRMNLARLVSGGGHRPRQGLRPATSSGRKPKGRTLSRFPRHSVACIGMQFAVRWPAAFISVAESARRC